MTTFAESQSVAFTAFEAQATLARTLKLSNLGITELSSRKFSYPAAMLHHRLPALAVCSAQAFTQSRFPKEAHLSAPTD